VKSTKASSKGQMVIPKPIRDALDIRAGTELSVVLLPGEGFKVTVKLADRKRAVRRLAGSLAGYAAQGSAQTDDEAVARVLTADDARIRRYALRKTRRR
jgi:AbrB family looped-hinge helix DNA binding protein